MTEELNNFNTDMKELFINNKIEEIIDALANKDDEEIRDLTYTNYDVIKKYYDSEKFDLIFTHIKFVAYSCFFCEYANKREILTKDEYLAMMTIFTSIYAMLQAKNEAN